MKAPSRIFLVGFMASGKSRIGKVLARKLQYDLIDIDHYLEAKADMTIPQIFETEGEQYFRKLEQSCLHELLEVENTVLSTGGGMACFFDNMKQMNQNGSTIFLKVPPPIIVSRLLSAKNVRPLVQQLEGDREALLNFVEPKLEERLPYYRQAQLIIDCQLLTPTKIVREILEEMNG